MSHQNSGPKNYVHRAMFDQVVRQRDKLAAALDEALNVGKEGHCIGCGDPLETEHAPRDPETCDHVSPLNGKSTVMENGKCYLCGHSTPNTGGK